MKKHHRLVSLASALLLALAALPCTAMAAEAGDTEPAQGAPPPAALYPAEVRTSEENGMIRLEKVYYLSTRDDPSAIPTGDFDREGRHYTLLDVLKNDLSETDAKDYIEVVTLDSSTKDMAEIIKTLEPEREIATEDGYTGILKPDYTKITVEAAGYKNNSWTVSASRTYPNLSDADLSLVPKTVTEGGKTGLTSVTTAILFGLALFLSPIFLAIPSFATAPALIVVGFYMLTNVVNIDFNDISEALPCYICIAAMPFFYSISEGISMGVISYVVLNLITGKAKEKKISLLMYVLAVLFILKYIFL